MVLQQDGDEPLQAAQHRVVQHHRPPSHAVGGGGGGGGGGGRQRGRPAARAVPGRAGSCRIASAGAAAVLKHEFQLRPIEGTPRRTAAPGRARPSAPPLPASPRTGPRRPPTRHAPPAASRSRHARIQTRSRAVDRAKQTAEPVPPRPPPAPRCRRTCASSCTKARPRISPLSAPDGSLRWHWPNSASRTGRSRRPCTALLKIWTCPGAVHRLQRQPALPVADREHGLGERLPMAALLPERPRQQLRRADGGVSRPPPCAGGCRPRPSATAARRVGARTPTPGPSSCWWNRAMAWPTLR